MCWINFSIPTIAMRPERAEKRIAINWMKLKLLASSENLKVVAPKIIGVDIRKENRAALMRSKPRARAMEMVAPEREMPGMMATA